MDYIGQVIGVLAALGILYWLYGKYQDNKAEKSAGKKGGTGSKPKKTSK